MALQMLNVDSCCDRQFGLISSLVEESMEINMISTVLFVKIRTNLKDVHVLVMKVVRNFMQ